MKRLIIFIGGGIVVLLFVFLLLPSSDDSMLTINYKNSKDVTISTKPAIEKEDVEGMSDVVARVNQSGQQVKLKNNQAYLVSYKGVDGYADGERVVTLTKNQSITINPYYSEAKLNQMLNQELPAIQSALKQKYSNINLYVIQPGKLYQWGDWYGTTLVYVGPYTPYRDTLRVVLKKDSNEWKVLTDPPYISLNKYLYRDVPVEILNEVNAQETPKPSKM